MWTEMIRRDFYERDNNSRNNFQYSERVLTPSCEPFSQCYDLNENNKFPLIHLWNFYLESVRLSPKPCLRFVRCSWFRPLFRFRSEFENLWNVLSHSMIMVSHDERYSVQQLANTISKWPSESPNNDSGKVQNFGGCPARAKGTKKNMPQRQIAAVVCVMA